MWGVPGPGGSLGECALCGESFVKEVITGERFHTIEIPGIEGELCLHKGCLETMEAAKGKGWEALPDGPLRTVYAEDAEKQATQEREAP
jgi:hypothetical protein